MGLRREQLNTGNMAAVAEALRGRHGTDEGLQRLVADIIARVRAEGDGALVQLTRQLDSEGFTEADLRVRPETVEAATVTAPETLMESLKLAADNIRLFHQHEMRGSWTAPMRQSQMLGQRMIPVDRAGLYVPGGGASYPSSVLMTAVPAQVAGVREIFICTPPGRDGRINQAVLAAAGLLGIEEIYRVGGAQAVAAMTYGTQSIRPADVICGPGNVYVTEAKRQVYGLVGLDSLAGPSEVLIIADRFATPSLIAADLLAQVEHGSGAIAALVCWSEELAGRVEAEVEDLAARLGIGPEMVERISIIMLAESGEGGSQSLAQAVAFSNLFAPEHLQVHTMHPEQVVHEITAAGAVFLGEDVCTAYGDYIIGSNHVLPTAGTARFGSALSVDNFLRKVAVISLIPDTISQLTPSLREIATAEGLMAHAEAARLRQEIYGQPLDSEEE